MFSSIVLFFICLAKFYKLEAVIKQQILTKCFFIQLNIFKFYFICFKNEIYYYYYYHNGLRLFQRGFQFMGNVII